MVEKTKKLTQKKRYDSLDLSLRYDEFCKILERPDHEYLDMVAERLDSFVCETRKTVQDMAALMSLVPIPCNGDITTIEVKAEKVARLSYTLVEKVDWKPEPDGWLGLESLFKHRDKRPSKVKREFKRLAWQALCAVSFDVSRYEQFCEALNRKDGEYLHRVASILEDCVCRKNQKAHEIVKAMSAVRVPVNGAEEFFKVSRKELADLARTLVEKTRHGRKGNDWSGLSKLYDAQNSESKNVKDIERLAWQVQCLRECPHSSSLFNMEEYDYLIDNAFKKEKQMRVDETEHSKNIKSCLLKIQQKIDTKANRPRGKTRSPKTKSTRNRREQERARSQKLTARKLVPLSVTIAQHLEDVLKARGNIQRYYVDREKEFERTFDQALARGCQEVLERLYELIPQDAVPKFEVKPPSSGNN